MKRIKSTQEADKKVPRKKRPTTAQKNYDKRKIANPFNNSIHEFLVDLEPSTQQIFSMQEQSTDLNDVFDLGDT